MVHKTTTRHILQHIRDSDIYPDDLTSADGPTSTALASLVELEIKNTGEKIRSNTKDEVIKMTGVEQDTRPQREP
jgi:hypothetical protein